MPLSITQLQEQIFQREGFRVSFERLNVAKGAIPPYDFPVMAPNTWTVADWRRVRLANYVTLFKGVTVFRGDGEPLRTDVRLAHLRDGYYKALYGTTDSDTDNVTSISPKAPSRKTSKHT